MAPHPQAKVHRAIAEVPWIIPQESHSALSLLDKTLEVIESEKIDVLCAAYLVPYGLVGCLASARTNVPLVLQHGGSDIHKFLAPGVWKSLWANYLGQARTIVTDVSHSVHFSSLSLPLVIAPPYVPDPSVFGPKKKESARRPRLAIIGKANYYWRHKGWQRVIEIWEGLVNHCDFLIVSQGVGLDNFRSFVQQRLGNHVEWREFVHPSAMPDLLQSIDYLFFFEKDLPHTVFSNLPLEAIYCGAKIVIDTNDFIDRYRAHGLEVSSWEDHLLTIQYHVTSMSVEMLLQDFSKYQHASAVSDKDFLKYIVKNEHFL